MRSGTGKAPLPRESGDGMRPLSTSEQETLNRALASVEPMNIDSATSVLKEMKQVLDDAGVRFFLRQGTCLGAIRDKAIIPWDDDLDLGSVIGLHGLTEETAETVAATLREKGYIVKLEHQDHGLQMVLVKSTIRVEWRCFRVFGDSVYQYPAVRTPVRLFADPSEIEFLGDRFYVPNPPDEYLRLKYGEDWMTPKQSGSYEADVIALIREGRAPGRAGRLKQAFARYISGRNVSRLRALDSNGGPVTGAEVVVVGRSNIVGKPIANILLQKQKGANATVTICHTGTRDMAFHTRRADILIVAAGRPKAVTGDMVKEGVVVIDVGVNRIGKTAEGKAILVGDVDFDEVKEKAKAITPVPGGVGPMTITMLMLNTVKAAKVAAGLT